MSQSLVNQLQSVVGATHCLTGAAMQPYVSSPYGYSGPGVAVVRPATTDEVAKVVRICAEHNTPMVPQGGNTGLCGGSVPEKERPAVLISLTRMNEIESIDAEASTMVVQAGCLIEHIQNAADEIDRTFAPDWGARGSAMAGGAVATNGGGINVLRYGNTREQVLGLEVVLPNGKIWNGLRELRKDNSGYDLKHLFVGSEGTLGIITRVCFRLHPRQPVQQSLFAAIENLDHLLSFLSRAQAIGGDRLNAFELMPGLGIEKALQRYPDLKRPLEKSHDWYLLVRFAGVTSVESELIALFEAGFEAGYLKEAVLASSLAQENNLWEIRDAMMPRHYFDRPMLKWDVSVPLGSIVDFLRRGAAIAHGHQQNAIVYACGHVGDGNIHYSVFPDEVESDENELCRNIYDDIDHLIWSLNGSIVAEHGVGIEMRSRVRQQKSTVEYQMMQTVKQAFDPKGIMNPGKLLES